MNPAPDRPSPIPRGDITYSNLLSAAVIVYQDDFWPRAEDASVERSLDLADKLYRASQARTSAEYQALRNNP